MEAMSDVWSPDWQCCPVTLCYCTCIFLVLSLSYWPSVTHPGMFGNAFGMGGGAAAAAATGVTTPAVGTSLGSMGAGMGTAMGTGMGTYGTAVNTGVTAATSSTGGPSKQVFVRNVSTPTVLLLLPPYIHLFIHLKKSFVCLFIPLIHSFICLGISIYSFYSFIYLLYLFIIYHIHLQQNLTISNSVNSKYPLFRSQADSPSFDHHLVPTRLFRNPTISTIFHVPWDFEIAGFDCTFYIFIHLLIYCFHLFIRSFIYFSFNYGLFILSVHTFTWSWEMKLDHFDLQLPWKCNWQELKDKFRAAGLYSDSFWVHGVTWSCPSQ